MACACPSANLFARKLWMQGQGRQIFFRSDSVLRWPSLESRSLAGQEERSCISAAAQANLAPVILAHNDFENTSQQRLKPRVLSPGANSLLRFLRVHDNDSLQERLQTELARQGGRADIAVALMELRRQRRWSSVVHTCTALLSCPSFRPDVSTFNVLIDAYGRLLQPGKAREVVELMDSYGCIPSEATYNALINAHSKSGDMEGAEGVFREMNDKGYTPSIVTYNVMLEVYGNSRDIHKAEAIFRRITSDGFSPTVNSFTLMVHAYGRACQPEKAATLFSSMHTHFCLPNSGSFTALIRAYASLGMHEHAEKALADMQALGMVPDVYAYNALLEAYSAAEQYAAVEEIFLELIEQREAIGGSSKTSVSNASDQKRRLRRKTASQDNNFPNAASFAVLMGALVAQGKLEEAELRLHMPDSVQSPQAHLALLRGYAASGQPEKIASYVQSLQHPLSGTSPLSATVFPSSAAPSAAASLPNSTAVSCLLLEALGTAGRLQEMDALFSELVLAESQEAALAAVDPAAAAASDAPAATANVLLPSAVEDAVPAVPSCDVAAHTTESDHDKPTANLLPIYNSLLRARVAAGDEEGALRAFQEIQHGLPGRGHSTARIKPDISSWNALIRLYSRKRLLRKCISLVNRMVKEGRCQPNAETVRLLDCACRSPEQKEEVDRWLLSLRY